jgi:putative ABC transport system ATP-binding protein
MIALCNISKSYQLAGRPLSVLRGIDLDVATGEFIAIMGPSGSGKSTLLNVMGILDDYDDGEYSLDGVSIRNLSPRKAAHYRNRFIGFVFQAFNLLPFLRAWENVALPLQYRGVRARERRERAHRLLERVGMADRVAHFPSELSGGQCQRVAIARALVTQPKVLFADEPTGNLDSATSREIMGLFSALHGQGTTIVMVTHEDHIAARAQRIIQLHDGRVVSSA